MKKIMSEKLGISKSQPLKARFFDYKHFTYPWHFHPEYEIIYIKEGSGLRFIGSNINPFEAGSIILIGANLPHYLKNDDVYLADNNLRVKGTIIQFEQDFMNYAINNYHQFAGIKNLLEQSNGGIYFDANNSPKMRKLLETIPLQTGINQFLLFLQLIKEMSEDKTRQSIATATHDCEIVYHSSRIEKVITFLNKNYTRNIRLEEISSYAAMNPSAFCRFFKSKTSKSFKNYLLDMRISYACKLLIIGDKEVARISGECGFDTISYFNKSFKKIIGHTPTTYRKMMLNG